MKRSRHLALMLMGTSPLLLTACAQEERSEEGLYTSVDACIAQTNDSYSCQQAFSQAEREAMEAAPRYATREECVAAHGPENCQEQRRHGSSLFMPMMAGFVMGRMLSGSSVAGRSSSPAFRDRNGGWQRPTPGGVYRAGAPGQRVAMNPIRMAPDQAPTTRRGGFGNQGRQRAGSGS